MCGKNGFQSYVNLLCSISAQERNPLWGPPGHWGREKTLPAQTRARRLNPQLINLRGTAKHIFGMIGVNNT